MICKTYQKCLLKIQLTDKPYCIMGSVLGTEDPWRTEEIQTPTSWIDTEGERVGAGEVGSFA